MISGISVKYLFKLLWILGLKVYAAYSFFSDTFQHGTILSLDQFTQDYWNIIIVSIIVFAAVFIRIIKTKKGRYEWHKLVLKMPIFGPIAKKMAISRFCHVLDTLDRTGVPILEALEISGKTAGNAFIEDRL